MARSALDAFILNALTTGLKAGGQAFLEELLISLGDKQLEAVKATADKILKSRSATVTVEK